MPASSRIDRARRLRRAMLATMLAATAAVLATTTTGVTAAASEPASLSAAAAEAVSPAIVDSTGLAFASIEAFCSYHCKPTHVARAFRRSLSESECDERVCAADTYRNAPAGERRQLHSATNGTTTSNSSSNDNTATDKSVARVNFMTCQTVAQSATTLAFELNRQHPTTSIFAGFHEAFYEAFDAMVTSANATYDACQLEFLQQKLLPTVDETSADALAATFTNSAQRVDARHPMLIKLQRDDAADERLCVEAIQRIWSSADEAMTPLLSRADDAGASATVMLMHVNAAVAAQLSAVACVASVTEMPPVLKLMPFARSASQLSLYATTAAPALEIRLAKGSDQRNVLARLQSRLQLLHGVANAFEMPADADRRPLVLFTKALGDVETWSHAVALALTDADVLWVDAKAETTQFTIRNSVYGQAMRSSVTHRRLDDYAASLVGVDGAKSQGIQGTDVVVGITDSGLYIDHDQFDQPSRAMYNTVDKSARKVVFYNAWMNRYDESADLTCGHGTHVAGILAGSSYSGKSRNFGIADAAKIAFMDIGTQSSACAGQVGCAVQLATPADAADLLKSQIDVGARIFSFSWGTLGSDYSAQARDLDLFIYNNPDVLVVVAAGNSGEASAAGQRTISSPSGAKNVISVGASLNAAASFKSLACPEIFNERSVASFSSAGPTTDGRLKPDVVAPGMIITSSKSERPGSTTKSADTCDLQGTSQATPVVTGLAVLLFEWLRDGWWKTGQKNAAFGMTKIPAALLKALIIHSGEPLQKRLAPFETGAISCAGIERRAWSVAYPDVYQGYGKPNMSNIAEFGAALSAPTLYFLPNSTAGSEPSVAHGKDVKISFTVPRGVDLRATLVWTDPPGSLGAATILQHDLDLTVQIRNGSKKFVPLTASNSTGRDAKNNVEMVQVSYSQLLEAAKNDANSASLVGADGEIIVEAVIFGRSVLVAKAQTFAFVASSSGIGTAIGSALSDPTGTIKSIWTPWTIGAIAVGALVLLVVIACIVRCRTRRKRHAPAAGYPGGGSNASRSRSAAASRGPIGQQQQQQQQSYYAHTTPAGGLHHAASGGSVRSGGCPYCPFVNADPVVMVNHVEHMHGGGGNNAVPVMEGAFGMPVLSASPMPSSGGVGHPQFVPRYSAAQHHVRRIPDDERCPHCNFSSADPVILVNHVEHMHGG